MRHLLLPLSQARLLQERGWASGGTDGLVVQKDCWALADGAGGKSTSLIAMASLHSLTLAELENLPAEHQQLLEVTMPTAPDPWVIPP